jgi:glutamate:Na+ symporter, ESS family
MFALDEIQTLAFAGLSLFLGFGVLRLFPMLNRCSVPAPVIGGLLIALVSLAGHHWSKTPFLFDSGLQGPLMIAFFTTIGFSASVSLLKASGRQVLLFLGLAAILAVLQNVAGMLVAIAFGLKPLFGVVVGATTLAGGPATGLAFAPLFERAGVAGAASIAIASAMSGIVCGGLFGGPVAARLLRRHRLKGSADEKVAASLSTSATVEPPRSLAAHEKEQAGGLVVLKSLVIILSAMWAGSAISARLTAAGVTLPPYIGAMAIGALIRNVDDRTGWIGLGHTATENIGKVCLAFFLSIALMNLRLWELSGVALPLLVNMTVQIALVAGFCCWPLFQLMGRDYDSAVMAGGFVGFMLGITANAMAVMQAVVDRNGPAPRAFLVAPLVGAFFIDFTNAIIITVFINIFG